MIITDSIDQSGRNLPENIEVLSCAELIGEAINRIFDEESVSSLFKEIPAST
jgi:phosphoribosylpyrophosphate synthetase